MAPTATEAIVNAPRCTSGGTWCNSVRVITDIYVCIPSTWALTVINFDCIQLTRIRNYVWTSYTGERFIGIGRREMRSRQWNYWQQPMINYRRYVPPQMGFPVGGMLKSRSATCATTIRRRRSRISCENVIAAPWGTGCRIARTAIFDRTSELNVEQFRMGPRSAESDLEILALRRRHPRDDWNHRANFLAMCQQPTNFLIETARSA